MKKISFFSIVVLLFITNASFKQIDKIDNSKYIKEKTLFVIYIDNSRDKAKLTEGLSYEMFAAISKRINEISSTPNAVIAFYLSNEKPAFTTDIAKAKNILQSIDYTLLPSIIKDNVELSERLSNQDFDNIKNISIDYFVTEYYLAKSLMTDNGALLINGLPNKLQTYIDNDGANIKVNLYYPLASKSVNKESVTNYFNFQNNFITKNKGQFAFNPL